MDRRSVEVQRGISKFHNRRCAVVKKLEAVQNLQDNPGSKTRSRTHEVEEYNCMPYMQLRPLELFKPTYDSRERGLEAGGSKKGFEARRRSKNERPKIQRVKNRVVEYMSERGDDWTTASPSTREFEQRQAAGAGRTGATGVEARLEERKPEEDMRRTGRGAWARSTGLSRGKRVCLGSESTRQKDYNQYMLNNERDLEQSLASRRKAASTGG